MSAVRDALTGQAVSENAVLGVEVLAQCSHDGDHRRERSSSSEQRNVRTMWDRCMHACIAAIDWEERPRHYKLMFRVQLDQALSYGKNGRLSPVIDLEFVKNVPDMVFDGLLA